MSSFLRFRTLPKPVSALSTRRTLRTYATKNDGNDSQTTHQQDSPNHPIPSNNAKPTLRDGNQSPLADQDGNLKDDLPKDVKKHNEEMEERYDKPYNHTGDQGQTEASFKPKPSSSKD
ncbi:unnamed protein product [Penicillium olsonii]|uniref:Uncharacterized protein n=1 Tax=Penicillium olsonii TaxID=99116 RepID=A0A9W4HFA9_PENOL|nr:unnamed protein product [Penicillium olsonii]CAG8124311.1 unnamed protein product [Penicillium olsonii]